eukprot:1823878-Prymnesium_polylepis.1
METPMVAIVKVTSAISPSADAMYDRSGTSANCGPGQCRGQGQSRGAGWGCGRGPEGQGEGEGWGLWG